MYGYIVAFGSEVHVVPDNEGVLVGLNAQIRHA
jgi:hypothetical protein